MNRVLAEMIATMHHTGRAQLDGSTSAAPGRLAVLEDPRVCVKVVLDDRESDPDRPIQRVPVSLGHHPLAGSIEVVSYRAPPRRPLMQSGYAMGQPVDEFRDRSKCAAWPFVKVAARYPLSAMSGLLDHVPEPSRGSGRPMTSTVSRAARPKMPGMWA